MKQIITLTPPHLCDPRIAIAGCRAGATGILDLGFTHHPRSIAGHLNGLSRLAGTGARWGVRWDTLGIRERTLGALADRLPRKIPLLVLAGVEGELDATRQDAERLAERVLLEVTSAGQARAAQAAGYHGCIVKGHEAGGWVSARSSFILLQELANGLTMPFWIQGGVGLGTVAATILAGAAGVVLCEQLWATEESPVRPEERTGWQRFDGSETVLLGEEDTLCRLFDRSARDRLREIAGAAAEGGDWKRALVESLLNGENEPLIPAAQDIAFTHTLGRRFGTVGRIVSAFRTAIEARLEEANSHRPLAPGSSLARIHGTLYPIVQGPMTRVSDVVPFAQAVADGGALPFLALAVMRGPAVGALLEEAGTKLRGRPWGVGILGFVPRALRREQLEHVKEARPPFAVIAGGRPGQAAELEALGISTYLHVPSPGLLRQFVAAGARKFIFEGSECGGHIGPRTSFVLWQLAVETLTAADIPDPEALQLLFAGGVHNALSAAMLATITAPLAERGMNVGALLGSAYLFTREVVESGAIVPAYQNQALAATKTAVLKTSLGYATRCAATPFCDEFRESKQSLLREGRSADAITETLERFNIGRLRIASKGITHVSEPDGDDRYVQVDEQTQQRQGMYMLGDAATLRDRIFTIAELHEEVSIASGALLENAVPPRAEPALGAFARPDVAVVGMACVFPGAATLRALWQNVINRVDAVREVTDDRWPLAEFFDPDRTARDKIYSKWGGFIPDIQFDPTRYGIPPASLPSIEPIQLLALEVARAALEDAGFDRLPFPRERTAVVFASGGMADLACDYIFRTQLKRYLPRVSGIAPEIRRHIEDELYRRLPEWTEDSFPGILGNVIAGRVANRLDLGGSNHTVDAACAASLAALSTGLDQLYSRDADVVLVGAADGMNNAVAFMSFAKTQALSPQGRCRPFSRDADGIAISEGVAALVLKRLGDAERDGDKIYGLIKAVGSHSDGRNRSLTAPHPQGQIRCLRRAYEKAELTPATVGLVEAHGTGTALGDKVEIESLTRVFGECGARPQSCAVGSIKSMIGHTKMAAGLAGVMKGLLALNHRILPPTLGVDAPNSRVDFTQTPFFVNTEVRPWFNSQQHPRRAGVSAFGFGGANYHAVLEEYTGRFRRSDEIDLTPRGAEIVTWSREHPEDLRAQAERLLAVIEHPEQVDLTTLAFSAHSEEHRRPHAPAGKAFRAAIVATSVLDLRRKLEFFLDQAPRGKAIDNPQGVYAREISSPPGAVCFLFPGQGSQRVNMLRDIVAGMRSLHGPFERADALIEDLSQPLSRYIYPLPSFSPGERERQQDQLNATEIAQPALGVVELAALDALESFGLKADCLAGHSYGEYVALCAAGVMSRDDLIRLSRIRGLISRDASRVQDGCMIAVQADDATTRRALEGSGLRVSVANVNAPDQTVLGGAAAAIADALARLRAHGLAAKKLPVTAAFHTDAMQSAAQHLARECERVDFRAPEVRVFSNTLGAPYPPEPAAIRTLLARHIVEPVRFDTEIRAIHEAGARIFIEVGPGRLLSSLVSRVLQNEPHDVLCLDPPGQSGWLSLAQLLGRAYTLGLPVRFDRWFEGRQIEQMSLDELSRKARSRTNPGETVWRVNAARATPWNGDQLQYPAHDEKKIEATDVKSRSDVHSAQATSASAGHGSRIMKNEKDPARSATANTSPAIDPAALSQAQHNLARLIDLQREQQQNMQYLIAMQQQVFSLLSQSPTPSIGQQGTQADPPVRTSPEPVPPVLGASTAPVTLPPLEITPAAPPILAAAAPEAGPAPAQPLNGPAQVSAAASAAAPARTATPAPLEQDSGAIPSTEEFQSMLLRTVSERTGYPENMLDLDAHMEADLGIDSIKLIEILSTLEDYRDRLNGAASDESLEELAGIKTLRSIVEWYDRNRTLALADEGGKKKT